MVSTIKASGLVQAQAPSPAPARVATPPRPKAPKAGGQTRSPVPAPKPVQVKPKTVRKPFAAEALRSLKPAFSLKGIFDARRLMGIALVMGVVALGIIARPLLAGILLLLGIGGALLGGAAAVDPLLATRLPESWPAGRLGVSAVAMLAIGVMLVAL